jgi:hypothetical protein
MYHRPNPVPRLHPRPHADPRKQASKHLHPRPNVGFRRDAEGSN